MCAGSGNNSGVRDWTTEESKTLLRGYLRALQTEVEAACKRNETQQPHTEWVQFSKAMAKMLCESDEFPSLTIYIDHCRLDPNANKLLLLQLTMLGIARATCAHCGHIHEGLSDGAGVLRCGHDVITCDVEHRERTGKNTYQTTICMCDK